MPAAGPRRDRGPGKETATAELAAAQQSRVVNRSADQWGYLILQPGKDANAEAWNIPDDARYVILDENDRNFLMRGDSYLDLARQLTKSAGNSDVVVFYADNIVRCGLNECHWLGNALSIVDEGLRKADK